MDCLTKDEADERLRFPTYLPSGRFYYCPDCLTQLRETDDEDEEGKSVLLFYCPNDMCLNEAHYDLDGERS